MDNKFSLYYILLDKEKHEKDEYFNKIMKISTIEDRTERSRMLWFNERQ